MCDAEKDWRERSFRASGEINGCQKFLLSTNRKSTFLSPFLATSGVFSKAFFML